MTFKPLNISILIENDSAPKYVRGGWAKVLKFCGHNVNIFDPRREDVLDHFRRCEPDVYLGTTYGVDRATIKALNARPNTKVGLFGSCHGPIVDEIDRKQYPIDIATEEEIENVSKIQNYKGVFIHHTPKTIEKTMWNWLKVANSIGGIMNASDIFSFLNGIPKQKYLCDIAFVGGYWPYKARNIDKTLIKLCENKDLNIKIYGNGKWPVAQYGGFIEESEMKHLFASATICLNISEPHSTDLGFDIIERVFKVPSSNGYLMMDCVAEMNEIEYDIIPYYHNTDKILEELEYCKRDPEMRLQMIRFQKDWVLNKHTYFHRVSDIFQLLNMEEEANDTISKYKELRKANGF